MAQDQFQRVKHCDQKTKDIVNGYVRRMQLILPHQENPYFIIDQLIQTLILLFFHKLMDSEILTEDEQCKLFQLFEQNANDKFKALSMTRSFNLIYKTSNCRENREEFVNEVYDKGNIIVLIHTENNNVIGGYTSIGWNKSAKQDDCVVDDDAFIFGIRSCKGYQPQLSYIKHDTSKCALSHDNIWICLFGDELANVTLGIIYDDVYAYDQKIHLTFTDDYYLFGEITVNTDIASVEIYQISQTLY